MSATGKTTPVFRNFNTVTIVNLIIALIVLIVNDDVYFESSN